MSAPPHTQPLSSSPQARAPHTHGAWRSTLDLGCIAAKRPLRVAVAGNPNSGKTTLFNALSQQNGRVGNFCGVTIARKEGRLHQFGGPVAPDARALEPGDAEVMLVDLPGCYSLTARSGDEGVSQQVLLGTLKEARCHEVLCVVDATQLARGLYLVLQLQELGLRCLVALTMMDLAHHQGLDVRVDRLSDALGLPVYACSAQHNMGIDALAQALVARAAKHDHKKAQRVFDAEPDARPHAQALGHPTAGLFNVAQNKAIDSLATVLARDADGPQAPKVPFFLGLATWLATHRPETMPMALSSSSQNALEQAQRLLDPRRDGACGRRAIARRFAAVDRVVEGVLSPVKKAQTTDQENASDTLDRYLLHPVYGTLLLVCVLVALFQAVFFLAQPAMDGMRFAVTSLGEGLGAWLPPSMTRALLVDGIVAGAGNVVSFVPQVALLFLGIAVLEQSGYMARAALLLDRCMAQVGLHGRAFVPLLGSFACAVPGIMAARIIPNKRDRLVTMLIAPFMSCAARLPAYTVVIAATFHGRTTFFGLLSLGGLLIAAMYVLGFVAALATAAMLGKTVLPGRAPPLILELPSYRMPLWSVVWRDVARRCTTFVTETGKVIVALSVLMWILLSVPAPPWLWPHAHTHGSSSVAHSWAGCMGQWLEPALLPLGFDWRLGVGLIAAFAARETLVSTLAQIYASEGHVAGVLPPLTPLVGTSLMVFFALALQCTSTVATLRKETQGWRWPLAALFYMNALAYLASLAIYQGGRALGLR